MDAATRRELLTNLAGAIDRDSEALAFFLERELTNYFAGTLIGEEQDRLSVLSAVANEAERMGYMLTDIYIDDDEDPTSIIIEHRGKRPELPPPPA